MSSFVKHQAPTPGKVKIAVFLGIVWAALLGGIWLAYRNQEGGAGGLFHFIARFHVLIVHFPIGVIFLAAMMEFLSYFAAFSHLQKSMPFVLWLGFLSSIAATVVGYLLMSVESFAGRALDLHLYFGLAVVVFALLSLILCVTGKRLLTSIMIALTAFVTMASGHFGGAMVHEPTYLTEFAPEALKPAMLIGLSAPKETGAPETTAAAPGSANAEVPIGEQNVYTDLVVPILEKSCNECHNENKIKGKLRMDTHELLLAGAEGSDFPTVVPGDADKSEMIVRVMLPEDDDEFMPTKGDPLKPAEIKLLSLWIKSGAGTDLTVAQLGEDPAIVKTAIEVAAIHASTGKDVVEGGGAAYESVWDTLAPEEKAARMTEINEAAERFHFSIMPISAEDDRLRVNVVNGAKDFGDEQIKLLEPVADRIVWLDLARSQVTDEGMKSVGKMRSLERLHLENTKITDAGIEHLGALGKLEYLNLYGTKVDNGIFETFAKLPSLKKVYLWQTEVDPVEAKAFERSVNLEINTGADLPAAVPASAEKSAETKPEPAKPVAPKPAPAKPAEPAKPAATAPAPAKPATTAPAPAKPAETKPEPAKPAATTPAPAKPAPATAAPAIPVPAKPAATPPAAPTPPATPEKKGA